MVSIAIIGTYGQPELRGFVRENIPIIDYRSLPMNEEDEISLDAIPLRLKNSHPSYKQLKPLHQVPSCCFYS